MNTLNSNKSKREIMGLFLIFLFLVIILILTKEFNIIDKKEPVSTVPKLETKLPEPATKNETIKTPVIDKKPIETAVSLLEKVYLDVPFQVQAPNANWDPVHEEACEEASLLMVYHFIKKIRITDGDIEINNILDYEKTNKYGPSITLNALSDIASSYYKLNYGTVHINISIVDIKNELANGNPVIVGAAGKILPNPNFRDGGPIYHMLVIKGYDKDGFITNDPGTRLGNNFRYNYDDLFNSIHDWNSANILNGGKNYLVFD